MEETHTSLIFKGLFFYEKENRRAYTAYLEVANNLIEGFFLFLFWFLGSVCLDSNEYLMVFRLVFCDIDTKHAKEYKGIDWNYCLVTVVLYEYFMISPHRYAAFALLSAQWGV